MAKKDLSTVSPVVSRWVAEIECYEREFTSWEKRSKKIIDRYTDERDQGTEKIARFNVLYSNVQTLHPAIYANPPSPNVDRRFDSDDDLGRYSALVLERAVSYYVKNDMFDKVMKQATLDRLLPGRGVAWVRYVPVFEDAPQITDDETEADTYLVTEDVVPDYVHWCDFGHTWARTWQEVRAVWRRVYMTRADCVKRFGEDIGNQIPMDASVKGKKGNTVKEGNVACVYEIWDKAKKQVIWIHKGMDEPIDERDDPLGLKDFFPCPEPIYATISNDSLIPTPDFVQYQDQAIELDMLTARIALITKAVRVAGVYDGKAEGVDRLLSEGVENKLIPVDQWAALGDGKGLQGVISFFPLGEIVSTLTALYQAREQVKNDLYEITGISDIVRGQTMASETATAQQIKGQFATLRLDNNQKDAARFARDLVVIMTEIIAKHFSIDTIKQVSGVRLMTAMEKQQIEMQMQQHQMMAQQMQQAGQEPPQMPPIPEEIQELMDLPTWEEVEQLIRDDTARCFRIDIETDSTIKTDQDNEKQARVEFLGAVSGFMQQAVNVPPDLQPLVMEMLLFGVRGFKVSRELETTFETAMRKIRQAQEQPQQPQGPSPEEIAAQAENARTELEGQKMQLEGQKMQSDTQVKQAELELRRQELAIKQAELQLRAQEMEYKYGLENKKVSADLEKSIIDAKVKSAPAVQETLEQSSAITGMMAQLAETLNQGLATIAAMQSQNNNAVVTAIQNPPPRQVIRDKDGRIAGVK
jgi:hypothetical protein